MGKPEGISLKKVIMQLPVKDIDRAKEFYTATFGLGVSWYMQGVPFCELFLPGKLTTLGLVGKGDGAGGEQGATLWFEVEDLESTKAHLDGRDIATGEITDKPGQVSFFRIGDTEGNTLTIGGKPRVQM